MTTHKERIAIGLILFAAISLMAGAYTSNSSLARGGTHEAQDVMSLDRRISSLEQRLYLIEANINRLQQTSMAQRTQPLQPSSPDPESNLFRAEIQKLQLQVKEIECGLIRLDERTTTPAAREARRSGAAAPTDPCRLNPSAPLRLSLQP